MWVAAVAIHRNIGRIVGDEVLAAKGLEHPLLNLVFMSAAVPHPASDFLESAGHDAVNRVTRFEMATDLVFRPGGLKACHQISRGNNVFAEAAHQFHGSR